MLGRLGRSTTGDKDGKVFPVGSFGPKEVEIRAASLRVAPKPLIFIKAVDRLRIRMANLCCRHAASFTVQFFRDPGRPNKRAVRFPLQPIPENLCGHEFGPQDLEKGRYDGVIEVIS